jgi:hypothetical protein
MSGRWAPIFAITSSVPPIWQGANFDFFSDQNLNGNIQVITDIAVAAHRSNH